MHDHLYVWFIAPIDYSVEWSLVDETFCENCSHFTQKLLQSNSFREICFLEESYQKMQKKKKIKIFQILREHPGSILTQGVTVP